jgi:hypothetical protein
MGAFNKTSSAPMTGTNSENSFDDGSMMQTLRRTG